MRTRGAEACPTHSLYRREGMGETGSAFSAGRRGAGHARN